MRLGGQEGVRRAPNPIVTVEDALLALLQNAQDAGAANIYVASSLRRRRYRVLTVIDDGPGVPQRFSDLILEPGVTSRHLDSPNAGLSLHHINQIATDLHLASHENPTAITATFDTEKTPERTLQSTARPSSSNMLACMRSFHTVNPNTRLHYGPPSSILAKLLNNHIIQTKLDHEVGEEFGAGAVRDLASGIGFALSGRTVRRVLLGEVREAEEVRGSMQYRKRDDVGSGGEPVRGGGYKPTMCLTDEEVREIAVILNRAAGVRYLEVGDVRAESRAGELCLRVRVDEPEEEYE